MIVRLSRWGVSLAACLGLIVTQAAACGGGGNGYGGSPDGGPGDDGPSLGFPDGQADGPSQLGCTSGQCPGGLTCNHGVCLPQMPACVNDSGCEDDTYCDPSGACVPYGSKPDDKTSNPACKLAGTPGVLAPKTFCEFSKPPAGDPFPDHVDVQATPIVVDFDANGPDPLGSPASIVVPFTQPVDGSYTEVLGIIRVLSGADCSLQANLGGVDLDGDGKVDWVNSSSAVAVGDLDGDRVADIVAYMGDRTTVAFTRKNGKWGTLWPKVHATNKDGSPFVSMADGVYALAPGSGTSLDVWGAPSIHDIDDDAKPEVIREGYVLDGQTGVVRAAPPASYASYSVGLMPVLADMLGDGKVELTNGAHLWSFDGKANAWNAVASYETASTAAGWAAVADFDPYDGKKAPEIAVASGAGNGTGNITVYKLDHTVFMGLSVDVPSGGGGPPTIADYDNDGLPEVGLAGANDYTVFDPDCQATPRTGGKCADRTHCDFAGGPCPDYILWSRRSQDQSSNITGSSVFDFNADGNPEAVYGDECFVRVYSGKDGQVLFSQYHSSCTWVENPVVADVDGDFRAELVVASNTACGPVGQGIKCGEVDANGVDVTYPGLVCQTSGDCVSGVCDSGLCRCQSGADCCPAKDPAKCLEEGYACAPPPMGTPGNGNTCRAAHPHGVQGIRVYKDAQNRWVSSRKIWNQHAYAVTNANPDGTIPQTSNWATNWTTPGLNNFRQNVPGTPANGQGVADLTVQAGPNFTCMGGGAVSLQAVVCNRGADGAGAGAPVDFYVGNTKVCSTKTPAAIGVAQCIDVPCTWMGGSPAVPTSSNTAIDVKVVVNATGVIAECDYTNDDGLVEHVWCQPAM